MPNGRKATPTVFSSLNDKLSSKVASLQRIKSAYPYIVRSFIVIAIFALLTGTYNSDTGASSFNAVRTTSGQEAAVVIDDVTEREVSVLVAQLADIIETDNVQAAANNNLAFEPETDFIAKNQVVVTDAVTRADILTHTVKDGESLADIAKQYDITTDTIKWANDLDSDTVSTGAKLTILPIDGILHTVKSGDTVKGIADRYSADADSIVAFNDAEISGLVKGNKIIIPGGTQPEPVTNTLYTNYVARASAVAQNYGYTASGHTYLMHYTAYGANHTYDRGWCTDWAAYRAAQLGNPVNNQWGNAAYWDSSALADGYYVGPVPKVGAVFQSDRGWAGHVGVVEEVSSDGTKIKYSDMNGLAGWGNAAKTNSWIPATNYEYIYR